MYLVVKEDKDGWWYLCVGMVVLPRVHLEIFPSAVNHTARRPRLLRKHRGLSDTWLIQYGGSVGWLIFFLTAPTGPKTLLRGCC